MFRFRVFLSLIEKPEPPIIFPCQLSWYLSCRCGYLGWGGLRRSTCSKPAMSWCYSTRRVEICIIQRDLCNFGVSFSSLVAQWPQDGPNIVLEMSAMVPTWSQNCSNLESILFENSPELVQLSKIVKAYFSKLTKHVSKNVQRWFPNCSQGFPQNAVILF